jgi:hypothetical protein
MKAVIDGTVIAEAAQDDLIKIEGNWYFPPSSVKKEYLVESATPYTCPWKGASTEPRATGTVSLDGSAVENQTTAGSPMRGSRARSNPAILVTQRWVRCGSVNVTVKETIGRVSALTPVVFTSVTAAGSRIPDATDARARATLVARLRRARTPATVRSTAMTTRIPGSQYCEVQPSHAPGPHGSPPADPVA